MWLLTFGLVSYDVYGVAAAHARAGHRVRLPRHRRERQPELHLARQGLRLRDAAHLLVRSAGERGTEDTLSISCTRDNSSANPRQLFDPPEVATWGENTQQEMCYALMYVGIGAL